MRVRFRRNVDELLPRSDRSKGARTVESAIKKEKEDDSAERGGGIEQRIPERRSARRNEDLVKLVDEGIDSSDEPSNQGPRPVPGAAVATCSANPMIEEETENEVLDEMGAFPDEVVGEFNTSSSNGRVEPTKQWLNDGTGVLGGEGIRRKDGDENSPEKGGPPGAEPGWDPGFLRNGWT
jgi:hypothetical protein